MKKVVFDSVVVKNFLSIGETPVSIDFKKGLSLITGRNLDKPDRQNGLGKSSMAESVYFAIFGETLRELKKDLIDNNITGGTTQVELKFSITTTQGKKNYHIIRTLSPSKVYFYEDGTDKTRDSISNTTKYICDILSASPSVFQNCVIMSVNNAVPFMAKNKTEKRKFIEDIFGMEIFSKMISVLKQEYLDTKRGLDIQMTRFDEITRIHSSYISQQESAAEKREQKRKVYLSRKDNNTEELLKLEDSIRSSALTYNIQDAQDTMAKLKAKLIEVDDKVEGLVESVSKKEASKSMYNNQLKGIGTSESKCPVCLRAMDEHDKEYIQNEKEAVQKIIDTYISDISVNIIELDQLRQMKTKLKKAIQSKGDHIADININAQNVKNSQQRIKQLKDWQDELDHDIRGLDATGDEFDAVIKESETRLQEADSSIKDISKHLSKLDVVKFVISEEGVKSYIVNKLLELLNSRLYYYLKKLDSNCICVFNEYFEEEIVNEGGKICSYFNFSGAERKAIDLACLFAFSDMRRMQGGISYNIAIYDELFDSSFDEKSIELISEILQERIEMYDECDIVISHRRESIKAVTAEVIFLEKLDGITKRVEYVD